MMRTADAMYMLIGVNRPSAPEQPRRQLFKPLWRGSLYQALSDVLGSARQDPSRWSDARKNFCAFGPYDRSVRYGYQARLLERSSRQMLREGWTGLDRLLERSDPPRPQRAIREPANTDRALHIIFDLVERAISDSRIRRRMGETAAVIRRAPEKRRGAIIEWSGQPERAGRRRIIGFERIEGMLRFRQYPRAAVVEGASLFSKSDAAGCPYQQDRLERILHLCEAPLMRRARRPYQSRAASARRSAINSSTTDPSEGAQGRSISWMRFSTSRAGRMCSSPSTTRITT